MWPDPESREPSGSGTEIHPRWTSAAEAAEEAALLVDLAIRRARANPFVIEEVKEAICGPLEEAKRQILLGGWDAENTGPEVVREVKEAAANRWGPGADVERGWPEEPVRKRA